MDNEMDIFNLITQAQIGIEWIFESTVYGKSNTIPLNEVLTQFKQKHENCEVFNPATALMYAYVSLVMPKETIFDKLMNDVNVEDLKLDKFIIIKGKEEEEVEVEVEVKVKDIIRRVRNALAHGHISVKNGNCFVFKDKKPNSESFDFEVKIEFNKFGEFLENYYNVLKDRRLGSSSNVGVTRPVK